MDDAAQLAELNEQFIEAFRRGSWELLEPVLAPAFSYLDGATDEVWEHERYIHGLCSYPAPTLALGVTRDGAACMPACGRSTDA